MRRTSKILARVCLLAFGIFLTCTCGLAEDASDSSLRELIAITQQRQALEYEINVLRKNLEKEMDDNFKRASTFEEKQKWSASKSTWLRYFNDCLSWEQIEPALIAEYRKYFDESEVRSLLEFLKSPLARKFFDNEKTILSASTKSLFARMRENLEKEQRQ